jgi:protein O-GlcNAc transferase
MLEWESLFQEGLALTRAQDWSAAESVFEKMLRLEPQAPEVLNNLGLIKAKKAPLQAQALFESALTIQNLDPVQKCHIQRNLADLIQASNPAKAKVLWLDIMQSKPPKPEFWLDGCNFWLKQGEPQVAFEWLQSGLLQFPGTAALLMRQAELAESWLQYPQMIACCFACLKHLPPWDRAQREKVWAMLSRAYQAIGELKQAHWALEQARECLPKDSQKLLKAMLLPLIYESKAELLLSRRDLEKQIEQLLQEPPLQIANPTQDLPLAPFYLAFQGFSDRAILEAWAEIYKRFLPAWQKPLKNVSSGPIKLAFVSHFFHEHSIVHLFEELIFGLDPTQFEVILFAIAPTITDKSTQRLAKKAAQFKIIEGSLENQLDQIHSHNPEVLIYTDLGSDPFTWHLAHYRLAQIQMVLPGIMHTTGLKSLDYYLSTGAMEPEGAENQYTEKLTRFRLSVAPIKPQRNEPLLSREELGLPLNRRVYLCPMTPFKFHPDYDELLARILAKDLDAEIWVLQHRQDGISQVLRKRWQKNLPAHAERIKLRAWMPKARFWHLLEQVDAVLDSWPVGGGMTIFTCLGLGIPIVTWVSAFFRGRVAAGAYELMQVAGPIAHSAEECSEIALKLAQAPEWRAHLKTEILSKNDILFSKEDRCKELSDFIKAKALPLRQQAR